MRLTTTSNKQRTQYGFMGLILLAIVFLAHADIPGNAVLLNIQGAIGPATSDYIQRGIQQAERQGAPLVIIRLDTPGGLDKSMRTMIKAMLASSIPTVVYVAPSGARAASAGAFLIYASHIAAMAPGTNLGAASPVSIGGGFPGTGGEPDKKKNKKGNATATHQQTMKAKVTNDAIAYIRSLAQMRGRNIKFAESAVREAATLTSQEALQQNVIEIVAKDLPDLIQQLNGRSVTVQGKVRTLNTTNLEIEVIQPDWRSRFLAVITDPSVAYILMLIGVYGLFFEFANPGFIIPGVVGAIALLLALYAFQLLPINYAGLGLILLGIIFIAMEALMPSFGALGIGGIIAFIVGSILLFDPNLAGYQVAWPLIFAMAILNGLFFFFVLGIAIRARTRPVVTGREQLIGIAGEILEDMQNGRGQAQVHGEIWQIVSPTPLKCGTKVVVTGIKGLTLEVEPIEH